MKRIAAVVVLILALTACSSGARRTATSQATASPATTPTTVDPTVIPPVITIDYLNAVLAVIDHVRGDAFRIMVSTSQVPAGVTDRIRAIYNDPLYSDELQILTSELATGLNTAWASVRKPPGDQKTTVTKLLSESSSCIWFQSSTDLSAVLLDAPPPAPSQYLAVSLKPASNDQGNMNPTKWAIVADATYNSQTPPPTDPCASR